MKKKQKKRIKTLAALLAAVVTFMTLCAVVFFNTYDLGLDSTKFTVANEKDSVLIQWDKTENAKGYYIYRNTEMEKRKIAEVVGQNHYYDKNVVNGEEYVYSMVAYTKKGKSLKKEENACVYIDTPVILDGGSTNQGVSITWTDIENSDSYNIYRKNEADEKWSFITQVSGEANNYCDENVVSTETYSYSVSAVMAQYESGCDDIGYKVHFVAAPRQLNVTNVANGVKITWSSVSLVDGYEIYRRDYDSGKWQLVKRIEDSGITEFIDKNVSHGAMYQYKVNTYYGSTVSDYNSQVKKTVYVSPTVIDKVNMKENGFLIQWIRGKSVDGYVLYRRSENEKKWSPLAVINSSKTTEYLDTTAESGKKYYYTVSQNIGEYSSAYDVSGDGHLFLYSPKLSVRNSPSGVKLTWSASKGAAEYRIYRKSSVDGKWTRIARVDGSKTSFIDEEAPYGKKTRYKISARAEGTSSRQRDPISLYPVDPTKPMVALTYDDGPYAPATNSIIKTLKKHEARATFFLVGSRVSSYKDCVKNADKIGCEIANHTYEHTILTKVDKKKIKSEISKTNSAVYKVIGKTPAIVRAPGGAVDKNVLKYVKYPLVNWSVDTLDWKYRNAKSITSIVKSQVEDGSIILMHDLYMSTAEASKTIVPWLIKQGYQLVTVSEMMETKGVDMKRGNLYTSAEK